VLRRLILAATGGLLALALAAGGLWWWIGDSLVRPLAFDGDSHILMVERGSSLSTLARRLASEGLTSSALPLQIHARLAVSGKIHAGEYRIDQGDNLLDLVDKLLRGDVVLHRVTFPEGRTLAQWLDIIAAHPLFADAPPPDKTVLAEFVAAEVGADGAASAEGWFFPDTYSFPRSRSPLEILRDANRLMKETLADEWGGRAADLPLDSPYEALILASIIEKETGIAAERGRIAGVFIRRLKLGMRLQTDPTVIYGLGEQFDGNLTRQHLAEENPYNTYRIPGLPPTPIANPGREAIHAALHPEEGTELYFVARGDGSHQFSDTLAEHQRAVREYQLNRRKDYRSAPATSH